MKNLLLLLILISFKYSIASVHNVPNQYSTIQLALNVCLTGDTVMVQPGTYFESIYWPNTSNIKLLSAGDSSNTIINAGYLDAVITFYGNTPPIDSNTIIKGFKITAGGCSGGLNCGGIYITDFASPKFIDLSITNNYSNWGIGAGINANDSDFILENSSVSFNIVDSAWNMRGGGIYSSGGSPTFYNVNISGNICTDSGTSNNGGGLHIENGANVSIYNTTINDNSMGNGGGTKSGGGANIVSVSNLVLNNVLVSNNFTGNGGGHNGGGMRIVACGTVQLTNVSILNNRSGTGNGFNGGGLIIGANISTLNNVLIAQNQMGNGGNVPQGGGLYVLGNPNFLFINNSTIANNFKTDSIAVYGSGISSVASCTIQCRNSIIWNPGPGFEMNTTGTNDFQYCNIRGGFAGTGNIDIIPNFVSNTDFHLSPGSACINAGTLIGGVIPYDLDNMPRPSPIGTNPDMGCYELDQLVNIDELGNEQFKFLVYPNPASNVLHITFNKALTGRFELRNNIGKTIKEINITNESMITVNLDKFSWGTYFIKLIDGEHSFTSKIIITNN